MLSSLELLSPRLVEPAWRVTVDPLSLSLRFQRYWQSWLPVGTLTLVVLAAVLVGVLSGMYSGVAKDPFQALVVFLIFWVVIIGGAFLPPTSSVWRGIFGVALVGILVLPLLWLGGFPQMEWLKTLSALPTRPVAVRVVPRFQEVIAQGSQATIWRSKDDTGRDPMQLESELRDRIEVRVQAGHLAWTATSFLVVLAGAGLIGASLYVIYRSVLSGCGVILRGLTAVGLLVGGLIFLGRHYHYSVGPPLLVGLIGAVFDQSTTPLGHTETLTKSMNVVALVAICLVTLAVCTMLSASANPANQTVAILASQMRWEQILLYVGAAALTFGAREISSLYTLPSAWFPEAIAKDIERLANAAATGGGVFLSAILLAIFVPAELVLRARAQVLAQSALPHGTPKERGEWLTARNLAGVDFKSFTTLGAVLGPVLASGPLSVVLKGIGG